MNTYQLRKLSQNHKKRTRIEAVIGCLKLDHRLNRNFYKGTFGDTINIMLAAAAFNFKRMMNIWKKYFFQFFETLFSIFQKLYYSLFLIYYPPKNV